MTKWKFNSDKTISPAESHHDDMRLGQSDYALRLVYKKSNLVIYFDYSEKTLQKYQF